MGLRTTSPFLAQRARRTCALTLAVSLTAYLVAGWVLWQRPSGAPDGRTNRV